jgi:hypothetical protein
MEEHMRILMLALAGAACLGLAAPAAAERISAGQSGSYLVSAGVLDSAQFVSSQKKTAKKKKSLTKRSSWGG